MAAMFGNGNAENGGGRDDAEDGGGRDVEGGSGAGGGGGKGGGGRDVYNMMGDGPGYLARGALLGGGFLPRQPRW